MRLTGAHRWQHWTTPYAFMARARWSTKAVAARLAGLLCERLGLGAELVVALDDTLVRKWGRKLPGVGYYPDPTDKNPGAHKRRVLGHSWVVAALLWERVRGQWLCFPLRAFLFVPEALCAAVGLPFMTKIELAARLVRWIGRVTGRRLVVVVDNLYAKAMLLTQALNEQGGTLISRLRSNAALYHLPPERKKGRRGRNAIRGAKVSARGLYNSSAQRRLLRVHIYGRRVTIRAWVGVLVSSPTLASHPILAVIFPQRWAKKMNIFFSTDTTMDPVRLLELYSARFKIEDAFDELKNHGGFGHCRQRSLKALKRHACLTLLAYSLLRMMSVTMKGAQQLEIMPWWSPQGPPSVTRMRRACFNGFAIKPGLVKSPKLTEIRTEETAA
jgi:hypothetical protein